ncbi:histidinol-phosphate transaminase [Halovivax gelatinilyticus]|uniref:histidinol-phosphate transaminase n=1 Tax=Halovivax gelatinilyticus TaxID=2961597 RepID=UPI0020CA6D59|nr:histidinol-phosphate transaminase [Halovivax gelatinilyticus]
MQPRDLSTHATYEAGRGIEEVARELGRDPDEFVKLASNENPHGPSPRAVETLREHVENVHTYPKAAHADLTEAIAERWNLDPSQVWLANGGDGAIDYLSRAMLEPGDRILVPEPGFAYYAMSARFHHGRVETYALERETDFAQDAPTVLSVYDGHRIVYLTSPHNPTGSTIALEDVREIAAETDDSTLVVVDEAYGEFADVSSARSLIAIEAKPEGRDDVAVLRTFSKAFGLAGLRLGYALVPPAWADAYARVTTPFAASEPACRAGLTALSDDEHVAETVESARWARAYMNDHLDAPVVAGQGNFVLVTVGDASDVSDRLQSRGIIVRDCTSFGLPEYVRISCGTESETRRAVAALNEVLADRPPSDTDESDDGVIDS